MLVASKVGTLVAMADLAELPKSTLVQKLHNQISANKRAKMGVEALGEKVADLIGSGTAAATGAAIGWAEVRWGTQNGPLSIGPVELSLAVATTATALRFFGIDPMGQMSYVAAGAAGAYGAGRGRALALRALQSAQNPTQPKTGWDDSALNF